MAKYEFYAEMFNKFFSSTQMSATYKPVLVRALADIGKYEQDDLVGRQWIKPYVDPVKLDLDFLAVRLAKYYWDMEVVARMRHSPKRMADKNKPSRDIRIIELIREQEKTNKKLSDNKIRERRSSDEEKTSHMSRIRAPTLEALASENMVEFRKKVVVWAMDEVLDHLLKDMPDLYKWNKKKHQIEFEQNLLIFMKCSGHMVKNAACHLLARKLEQLNPSTRLAATITNCAENIEDTLDEMRNMYTEMLPNPLYAVAYTKKGRRTR